MEESTVSPSFCTPEPINFTFYTKALWLKGDDALAITDTDGVVVFQVTSSFEGIKEVIDNTGNTVLSMKKQTGSSQEQWQVFKGDSSHPKDPLFTMKKSSNFDSEKAFDLFLEENTAEKKCDYKIKGSYDEKTCILYEGDSSTVAFEISQRSRSDSSAVSQEKAFKVYGQRSMDYQFVVAVVAMLHVHHIEEKKETKEKKVMKGETILFEDRSTRENPAKQHNPHVDDFIALSELMCYCSIVTLIFIGIWCSYLLWLPI